MYFNTLIIMNEDTIGYGKRSKSPSGYCKIAMPNRIICYVQELKQLPKGQNYKLYLTSKEKNQSVEIGMFQVGLNGTKETRWIINPNDINNSQLNAKDIDGALVVVDGDKMDDVTAPLVGFLEEPYRWSNLIKPIVKKEEEIKVDEKAIEKEKEVSNLSQEDNRDEEKPGIEKEKEVPNLSQEDNRDEEKTGVEKEEETTTKSSECDADDDVDEIKLLRSQIEELSNKITSIEQKLEEKSKSSDTRKDISNIDDLNGVNNYIDEFLSRLKGEDKSAQNTLQKENDKLEQLFNQRIPINPFEAADNDISWVRINSNDLNEFTSLPKDWLDQPVVTEAYDQFKHFILGRDQIKMQYYLGIPDIYSSSKNYVLEVDKIESFNCCRNSKARSGEAGYWMVRL